MLQVLQNNIVSLTSELHAFRHEVDRLMMLVNVQSPEYLAAIERARSHAIEVVVHHVDVAVKAVNAGHMERAEKHAHMAKVAAASRCFRE